MWDGSFKLYVQERSHWGDNLWAETWIIANTIVLALMSQLICVRHFICVYSTFTTLRGIYLYYPIFYSSGNEGTERLDSNLNVGNQVSEPMLLTTTQSDATWIRQAAVCHAEETACPSSKAMRWEWAWHLQGIKDQAGQGAEEEGSEVHSMKHWMPHEVFSNGVIWYDVCFSKITLTAA